ncbi:immunoglobulin-like domain-containing protein [Alteribacillus iranensis]|uniref:Bacterial Ig-like domain-containing protein n=1 Tax=Alteribacillus iranensis TaxID=930128 RepID=A0A1I2FJJ4_9BACI|nr:immunoglobulin-like domain-containing protein [Alteribacillus iranensis]SFF05612.1 hypothetical protein SAMN05192532_11416 [Alteribacillus iranensis]
MWKTLVPVAIGILLLTAFAAPVSGASHEAASQTGLEGVSFKADQTVYSLDETVDLSLRNGSSDDVFFGTPYVIEVFKDGTWYPTSLTDDLMFTQQIITLPPGETYRTSVDLQLFGDRMSPGWYKIVKQVRADEESKKVEAVFRVVEK